MGGIYMNMKNKIGLNLIVSLLMLCFLNACDDPLDGTVYQTTEQQMLDEYMADHLGEFLKIVDKSDYLRDVACLWCLYLSGADG